MYIIIIKYISLAPTLYLRGAQKLLRIKVRDIEARRRRRPLHRVLAIFVEDLGQPTLQILMAAPIRQIVHQHNAVHRIVEYASRILVARRAANVPQFDEVGALRRCALLVLVQTHLDRAADRPAGRGERLVVGHQVREGRFANA